MSALFGQPIALHPSTTVAIELSRATVPSDDMREHAHAHGHIVLAISPGYRSSARPDRHSARAGEAIYNPPGVIHRDRFDDVGALFLSVAIPAEFDDRRGASAFVIRNESALRRLHSLIGLTVAPTGDAGGDDIVADVMADLDLDPQWSGPRPSWLRVACDLIEECHGDPALSVAGLACKVGVHRVHLARMFRAHLGVSPGSLLRRRRAEHALSQLQSETPLTDVAAASGFSDQSHMCRDLYAHFGVSPGRLRSLLRRDVTNLQAGDCMPG